jgi:hypothetical protein
MHQSIKKAPEASREAPAAQQAPAALTTPEAQQRCCASVTLLAQPGGTCMMWKKGR